MRDRASSTASQLTRSNGASSRFFSIISGVILALSVWGFSDNLIWNIGQPSNKDPKFILHGAFCLAWMILFFVQANLIRSGNPRIHRKLGIAGFLIAIGVVVTTLFVFWSVWRGWAAMPYYVKANRILFAGFVLLTILAYTYRHRPDWHKRLLLVGTLYLLEPILSRAFDPIEFMLTGLSDAQIGFYWTVFFAVTWNALFLSLAVHDFRTRRRLHNVSVFGYLAFLAVWPVALLS